MYRNLSRNIFFFLLFITVSGRITAQTLNMQQIPNDRAKIDLRFDKPFYKDNYDVSTFSGVFQVSLNMPVSSKYNVIASVPYINNAYSYRYYYYGGYYSVAKGIGNIFLGLQTNPMPISDKRSIVTFGVYLPTANRKAGLSGYFTNYYDFLKYVPDAAGVYFNYAYHKISPEGFNYGLEIGPNFLIPTESNTGTTVSIHYGIHAGYALNNVSLDAELLGMAMISRSAGSFNDIFLHLLDFGAQWNRGSIRPKVFYRIYLTEQFKNFIDGTLVLEVSVLLK